MAVKLRIGELRTQRGLTQEQLALRLGMSLKGYQYLEYKATSIGLDLIDQLCEELTCSPGDLFERSKTTNDTDIEKQNRLNREKRRQQKSERMKQWWKEKRKQQSKKDQ
ncbi:helix-turn-helix domain-containing protein [Candidatus Gracilibacteria bacterium]|nr:helix-turn-helix domain-containing protein [Candidatus Gracilibacteria bacterium]NJM90435.1 helix-turn-helix domain-containing protein [Hydrococcus sp. RU_2_2]NJP21863.1 helix-turn-helix domain-containing protein [Hydrococcus sp. CRU_1_1]NJQ97663.1 helix-turn-helix domain-containing protein [Hydrococcus sp. CSU_1_8]